MTPVESLRIAVIGSGPSGVYATEGVLAQLPSARVDVIDSGLSPYGLVRYGVAPDHQKIKSVTRILGRTLSAARVRYFGNVRVGHRTVGADLDLDDLRDRYHAVVLATGAPRGKRLGVPGEDLLGSSTAGELVPWYNGHPDAVSPAPTRTRSVVVVGAGNVALDIARVLLKGADGLTDTDVPDEVLERLAGMGTADVHVVARRGPEAVKFGIPELRALDKLDDVAITVDAGAFSEDPATDRPATAMLRSWATREPGSAPRRLHFHFGLEAVRIHGEQSVRAVEFARGSLTQRTMLPADLVVAAIGYRTEALPGVPFDDSRGLIPNTAGRIAPGTYVVGWAKRGPQGVIGTNRVDAAETVAALVADADALACRSVGDDDLADLLQRRGVRVLGWADWMRIDAEERSRGRARGRERTKVSERRLVFRLAAQAVGPEPRRTTSAMN
jgi:ferredoxin/flavodoxin---NADP+ reductase